MEQKIRRVTSEDLANLPHNKEVCFLLDFDALKTARQLVYNRQKKYAGCKIDTSKSYEPANSYGYFVLIMRREAYGRSTGGNWEPGTPQSIIKDSVC